MMANNQEAKKQRKNPTLKEQENKMRMEKKNEECFARQRHVRLLLGIIVGSGTFNSNMYQIVF